jgi:hypothetical protein
VIPLPKDKYTLGKGVALWPARKKAITVPLETICDIPDAAWERLQPILAKTYPPKATGRGRIDFRKAINGVIFRMRSRPTPRRPAST